jgi:hypothetical protein
MLYYNSRESLWTESEQNRTERVAAKIFLYVGKPLSISAGTMDACLMSIFLGTAFYIYDELPDRRCAVLIMNIYDYILDPESWKLA